MTGAPRREVTLGWLLLLLLAMAWALGPALPALLRGELLGHRFTDLYPSVWGLNWFVSHQPGLPSFAPELGWPEGMGFYYSSPLKGWLATPILGLGLLDLAATYNLLLLLSRLATPLLTFAWLRAEGLRPPGALAGAALFGCAPMFHGFAVEGIVEGTDAWTLPLWGLLVARRNMVGAGVAFALVVLSSWYLAAAGLLAAIFMGSRHRLAPITAIGGCALAAPALLQFMAAFEGAGPIAPDVRGAMGSPVTIPTPGLTEGLNPFAITSYLGWLALLLFFVAARRAPWLALGALAAWVLSLGTGPWYKLPGLEMIRFPYRLAAASLFLGAPVIGMAVDRLRAAALARRNRSRAPGVMAALAWGAGWLVALEGLALSPVEPVIPGSPAQLPEAYDHVEPTVLLEVPGPVSMPPGEINLSRPRARFILYAQARHGAATPWRPDFNAMAEAARDQGPAWLEPWAAMDALTPGDCQDGDGRDLPERAVSALPREDATIQVMIHPAGLAVGCATGLERALREAGSVLLAESSGQRLFRVPRAPR